MFYVLLLVVCAAAAALDQLIKALVVANIPLGGSVQAIPGLFHLTYVQNTGAAFSMLEGARTFFLILTAIFLAIMVYCAVKKVFPRPYFWFLAVITGGAIGNLIDRMLHGYVVDMFALDFMRFAVFNFADLCITFGAALLILYALLFEKRQKPKKEPECGNDHSV